MDWRDGDENCNLNKSPTARGLKLILFQISEDSNIYLLLNSSQHGISAGNTLQDLNLWAAKLKTHVEEKEQKLNSPWFILNQKRKPTKLNHFLLFVLPHYHELLLQIIAKNSSINRVLYNVQRALKCIILLD